MLSVIRFVEFFSRTRQDSVEIDSGRKMTLATPQIR